MPPIKGKIDGCPVDDKRTAILPPALINWYKKRTTWDKITDVSIHNYGLTIVVKLKGGAKHTWRYNDKDAVQQGRIKPLRTWDLEVSQVSVP